MAEKSMFDDMSEAELNEFHAEIAISAEKIKRHTDEQIAKVPKSDGVTLVPIYIDAKDFIG